MDAEPSRTIFHYIGVALVLKLSFSILFLAYDFIRSRIWHQHLRNLGEWAVITGSTDGIGKEIARGLARKGMDIVLISRSEEKLKDTAREIGNEFKVRTLYIQADFSDRNCYGKIKEELEKLDVGILVNNVGTLSMPTKPYTHFSTEELWYDLDVNCGAMMMMTRIVLTQMKLKKKGSILNIGSLSSETGFPFGGIYSATKAFMKMFTYNLQEEVRSQNIRVRCLIPGIIRTKLASEAEPFLKYIEKTGGGHFLFSIPSVVTFTSQALNTLYSQYTVATGYWGHTLLELGLRIFPTETKVKLTRFTIQLLTQYKKKQ